MPTRYEQWTVEVITTWAGQPFRVKDLQIVASDRWSPTGRLVRTIGEVCDILGADYEVSIDVRDKRFDAGPYNRSLLAEIVPS